MPNNCASIKRVLMFSKPDIISRWDDDYCEYMLVAPLTVLARERTGEGKIFLSKENGTALRIAFSYISITRFMARQRMEEIFSRWIRNICLLHCAFTLKPDHFNVYAEGNIYLKQDGQNPFQNLADSLRVLNSYMESNNCPPLKFENPRVYLSGPFPEDIDKMDPVNEENRNPGDNFIIEKLQLLRSDVMMNFNIVNNFTLLSPLPIPE